jgi:teichuronic acid biosynthesis glycosyltransferase TuaH
LSNTLPIVYLYPDAPPVANQGRQHLMTEALRAHAHVYYIATTSYTRSLGAIKRPYAEKLGPNFTVIHNAMSLRTNRYWKRLGPLAATIDAAWIHKVLKQEGVTDYVFWLSVPGPEWMAGMRLDRMVYDCIDPCFIPSDQANFDTKEYTVAAQAKLVLCTAQTLLERMQKVHSNAHSVPNAASLELYEADQTRSMPIPALLEGRPRPIIGYMGTTDWRVDCETMLAAAKALPEYTFCIAGRVNKDQEHRVTELRALPNVVMPGSLSTEDGSAYNKTFDVGVIPYLPGYVGDAINPVKMYMYLLTGKPVVSTWINECRLNMPLVSATQTPEEFIAALRAAANEPDQSASEARMAFARQNTWQERARRAIELIRSSGLFDTSASPVGAPQPSKRSG